MSISLAILAIALFLVYFRVGESLHTARMTTLPGRADSILMAFFIILAFIAVYFFIRKRRFEGEMPDPQEALRDLNAYNRGLVGVNINPVVLIDQDGKISDVNAAMELATGFSRKELIGTDFPDCFTGPEKANEGYLRVLKDGTARDLPLENLYLRPSGGMNA